MFPYLLLIYLEFPHQDLYFAGDFSGGPRLYDRAGGLQRGPVFLEEPLDRYYVVKHKPATVTCKALGAMHISFKCANKFLKENRLTNLRSVDAQTNKDIIQTNITVTRDEVEEYFGSDGYWCECYASDMRPESPGAIIITSKRGLIEVARK